MFVELSHYVYDNFPDVPSILDTQDLHFLRDLRKFYYKKVNSKERKIMF